MPHPPARPPQPPGHWSRRCPAFTGGVADLAGALDQLAGAAGVDDGLVLLQKLYGVTPEQVAAAGRTQAREWFYGAYDRHGGRPASPGGDVVVHSCGIWTPPSGWDHGGGYLVTGN